MSFFFHKNPDESKREQEKPSCQNVQTEPVKPRKKIFKIIISLTEPEILAVSRLATADMRDLRGQAHFLLRSKLIELGALDATNQESKNE